MTQADLAATGQPVPQSVTWPLPLMPRRSSPARVENFSPVFKFGTHHGLVTVGALSFGSGHHWSNGEIGTIGMRPSNQPSV